MLESYSEYWASDQEWSFKTKDDLIYIENISQEKFLESSSDGDVILKDFEEDKAQQLWKKGKLDAEGYFTLESQTPDSFILSSSASNSSILQIRGIITLCWIVNLFMIIYHVLHTNRSRIHLTS